MKSLLALTVFSFISLSSVLAAEADHYTDRDFPLQDISELVNQKANDMLKEAVIKANKSSGCNTTEKETELYEILRTYFGNHSKGELSKYLLYTSKADVPKRVIPLKQSIYGDWTIWNGYLLGKPSAAQSPLALSPMVKVGEQLIGIDKFEHMFGMGFFYFDKHYLKGKSLKKVLKKGIIFEKTILGGNLLATGVFAYADLAANFNGMRFWNHMLQKNDDILGAEYNYGPYITCENEKWKLSETKKIDFTNYMDPSMDESINCSKFASKAGLKKFKNGLKSVSEKLNDKTIQCPMSKTTLQDMWEKYNVIIESDRKKRSISHWIINREGPGKISYFNEF